MQSHVYSVYMYSKFFKLITIFSSLTDISQYMEQSGHSAKDFPLPGFGWLHSGVAHCLFFYFDLIYCYCMYVYEVCEHICAWAHRYHGACVEISFLLPPACGYHGTHSGCQACAARAVIAASPHRSPVSAAV